MKPRSQHTGQPVERPHPGYPGARPALLPRPAPHRTPSRRRSTLFNVLLLLCPRGKTLTSDTQMCESLNCMRGQSTPLSGKFKNMTSDSLCDCCRST